MKKPHWPCSAIHYPRKVFVDVEMELAKMGKLPADLNPNEVDLTSEEYGTGLRRSNTGREQIYGGNARQLIQGNEDRSVTGWENIVDRMASGQPVAQVRLSQILSRWEQWDAKNPMDLAQQPTLQRGFYFLPFPQSPLENNLELDQYLTDLVTIQVNDEQDRQFEEDSHAQERRLSALDLADTRVPTTSFLNSRGHGDLTYSDLAAVFPSWGHGDPTYPELIDLHAAQQRFGSGVTAQTGNLDLLTTPSQRATTAVTTRFSQILEESDIGGKFQRVHSEGNASEKVKKSSIWRRFLSALKPSPLSRRLSKKNQNQSQAPQALQGTMASPFGPVGVIDQVRLNQLGDEIHQHTVATHPPATLRSQPVAWHPDAGRQIYRTPQQMQHGQRKLPQQGSNRRPQQTGQARGQQEQSSSNQGRTRLETASRNRHGFSSEPPTTQNRDSSHQT
ncbi:MAG: hypothetical protein MMC33_010297 [Icmadophila ericetorum]|nr:hypothetical protein [Icmadophila ericetorum]